MPTDSPFSALLKSARILAPSETTLEVAKPYCFRSPQKNLLGKRKSKISQAEEFGCEKKVSALSKAAGVGDNTCESLSQWTVNARRAEQSPAGAGRAQNRTGRHQQAPHSAWALHQASC